MPDIQSDKASIESIFDKWYRVPEYQRPYVWLSEQVTELLEDIVAAQRANKLAEYFLGSIVYKITQVKDSAGRVYEENDLLDGQQRLTTCFMIMAVARDLTNDPDLKTLCQTAIYKKGNRYNNTPERMRIVFDIRPEVRQFAENFIKTDNGTARETELKDIMENSKDTSVSNMARAILTIRKYFQEPDAISLDDFFPFFTTKVLIIYVASIELDDAFRLFTVLNDRGMKLRNSDILKAANLKALADENLEQSIIKHNAIVWENLENQFGEEFDQFLGHVRTIIIKEKARNSLIKEFNENIYSPKQYNSVTKIHEPMPPLLNPGLPTFNLLSRYAKLHKEILNDENYCSKEGWSFDNLITVMADTLPSDNWLPPLMAYKHYFKNVRNLDFLKKLDNKFSADWILGETPTTRIDRVNSIIKEIERVGGYFSVEDSPDTQNRLINELLESSVFEFDNNAFSEQISQDYIYGKAFCKYLMYKLDFIYQGNERKASPKQISVEHILPQNPENESDWQKKFDVDSRKRLTNRLGNLVLISRRKNSSLGRLDYEHKKTRYFTDRIELFANSIRVLTSFNSWGPTELNENQRKVIATLLTYYGVN